MAEEQRQRGLVVSVRAAETVCQSSKPPHAHSDRQVEALRMAGVDAVWVWVISNRAQADFDYLAGSVAGRIFVGENLDDLAIVSTRKHVGDCVLIGPPAVRRNLKSIL